MFASQNFIDIPKMTLDAFPRSPHPLLKAVVVLLTLSVETSFAFSTHSPLSALNQERCHSYRKTAILSATTKNKKNKNGRSYDFIAVEEAEKMLQEERLKNEQEIQEMKILLERQHQELLEFNYPNPPFLDISNEEYSDVIDVGFGRRKGNRMSKDAEMNGNDMYESPFSSFTATMNDEQYRQQNQRSHSTAERRTLEISLQKIHEENEDLNDAFEYQRHHFQSNIDKTRRMLHDIQENLYNTQRELKMEVSGFERTKAELENVLEQERQKARELEEQLLLARREQEIIAQAAIEAQNRQQELQEQENQRLLQLEREEKEHQQQTLQLEEEERLRNEEISRNHQEFIELEKHQKQLDDLYFNLYNKDGIDNGVVNEEQNQQNEISNNAVHGFSQYNDLDASTSSQPPYFAQYSSEYQQWSHQQQNNRVSDMAQRTKQQQSKRTSKRSIRTNSQNHGIFMNFNDMLK